MCEKFMFDSMATSESNKTVDDVDGNVVKMMSDKQLEELGVFAIGDRMLLRRFCDSSEAHEAHTSSFDIDEPQKSNQAQARSHELGNRRKRLLDLLKSATKQPEQRCQQRNHPRQYGRPQKTTRTANMGLRLYTGKKHATGQRDAERIKSPLGDKNLITIQVEKNINYTFLKDMLIDKFFLEGENALLGKHTEYYFEVVNSRNENVKDSLQCPFTVKNYIEKKMIPGAIRLYLLCTYKSECKTVEIKEPRESTSAEEDDDNWLPELSRPRAYQKASPSGEVLVRESSLPNILNEYTDSQSEPSCSRSTRNRHIVFNMEGVKIEATDSDEKPDTTRVEDKETKVMEEKQEVEPNVSCQNEDMPDAESEMNTEETEPCAMDGIAVSLSTDEKTLLSDKLQDSNAEDLPTKTQFEQLLELCNEDYTICENHTAEMLEKNIVCKNCLQPMCALCLHQYHMGHSMISLVKLREIKKIKETLDKDVLALTEKQKFYKDESTIRNEKIVKIECEAKNIISGITQSFDQLVSVIEAKKKELCAHVLTFKNEQLNIINNELIQINEQQESILDLNEKMEAFYRSIDLKDAEKLPQRSGDILSKEVDYLHVAGDSWRPEKKYSKLLPSIQAVANICQTIRPEATKVVWWKVDSKKKERSDSSVDHPAKKRKIEPESPVMSHGSDQQTSPTGSEKHSTPPSGRVLRNSTEAPDSTCLWQDSSYDANEGDKEEEPAEDVNFACVDFDANGMTVGKKILVNGHLDNLWIGEVVDTRRLKSEKLFSVKWCSGIVGKQKSFQIGERWQSKGDTAHTACVVCHFDLDLSQPLSEDLEKVLLKAREEKERLDRIEKAQSRRVSRSSSRRKR